LTNFAKKIDLVHDSNLLNYGICGRVGCAQADRRGRGGGRQKVNELLSLPRPGASAGAVFLAALRTGRGMANLIRLESKANHDPAREGKER
jgi:hypothetical protein